MFDSILVVLWGPSIFMSYENSSIILFGSFSFLTKIIANKKTFDLRFS